MTVNNQEWLKQMEGILELLNEAVIIADDDGSILFVNRCMESLLSIPRFELIGKTAKSFYSGEDYEVTLARIAVIKKVGYDRCEFFVPRPDGTRVPVILSTRELETPDGKHFSVITCTEITEQKKAERSLREANAQLECRAEEIDRELALASRVQQSLAPRPMHFGRFAVETHYNPARTIGGDFGLVAPYDGTHLDLLLSDISGHGISSALLANRIYTETISLLHHGMELDEMLRTLNHFVIQHIGTDGFVFTMAVARLDQTGRLVYAAAGHPPALLISSGGKVRRLQSLGGVLGGLEEAVPKKMSQEFELSAADRLLLYSDGLIEVWNRDDEILGVEGLEKVVRSASVLPLPQMRQAIIDGINSYSAEPLHDDVTLILAEMR